MEPYKIQCPNCQSRIRVRNPNLVGQVVNCPKCASPLKVQPPPDTPASNKPASGEGTKLEDPDGSAASLAPLPPGQIRVASPEGHVADSTAMTKDGIAPLVSSPLDSADVTSDGSGMAGAFEGPGFEDALAEVADGLADAPQPSDPGLGALGDLDDYQLQPETETPAFTEVAADGDAVPSDWQASGPLLPSDEWTTAESTKKRQYLLIGLLGFFGILVAALGFVAFLRWASKTDDDVLAAAEGMDGLSGEQQIATDDSAADGAVDSQNVESQNVESQNVESQNVESQNVESQNVESQNVESQNVESQNVEQQLGASDPEGQSIEDVGGESSLIETGGADTDTGAVETDTGETDTGESSAGEMETGEFDPSDVSSTGKEASTGFEPEDPFGGGDASEEAGEQDANTQETGEKETALPNEWLQRFAPMLQWQVAPSIPDEGGTPGPAPVTAKDLGLDSSSDLEPIPPIDWQEVANRQVTGLILGDAPLARSISLLAQTTGVPTTANLDSFKAAKLDTSAALDFGKFQSQSISDIVNQLSANTGLDIEARQNQFLEFRGSSEVIGNLLPEDLDVSDLFASQEEAEWLVATLETLFPGTKIETKTGWKLDEMRLTRDPDLVDPLKWFEAMRMIEAIRFASGKPTQVEAYDGSAIFNRLVTADSMKSLENPVREFLVQSRPISQSIPRMAQRSGIHVWFDWPSLAEIGVGPSTTGVVFTGGRSLSRVLKSFTDQFHFIVAIESENDLWITSPRAYRRQARIYVLPSGGRTAEQWQEQLGFELTPLDADGVGRLTAILTPDRSVVIVRCCRPAL